MKSKKDIKFQFEKDKWRNVLDVRYPDNAVFVSSILAATRHPAGVVPI